VFRSQLESVGLLLQRVGVFLGLALIVAVPHRLAPRLRPLDDFLNCIRLMLIL
jgi:hypothetical protein